MPYNIRLLKNSHIRLLLLNFLFLIRVNGSAQNIQISTLSEDIRIRTDTTFVRDVNVFLKKSDKGIIYPVFYDSKLENLSGISVSIKKGTRFKPLKNPVIQEENVNIDLISSKKIKSVFIPPDVDAKISYSVECNELMYFSDLPLFSYDDADTLKYQVTVPETFWFLHDIIYKDSLDFLSVDSLKSDRMMKWNIKVVPGKVNPDPLMYFGIYKNLKVPLMRTIVVPAAFKYREKEYLNDWYLSKLETTRGLDSAATQKIDELTGGISDPMEILDILYNYVKSKFKYVAIELGMGAFIPSHTNEVFVNKQGDCKDLSNFLSDALNYKGIKTDVALAATFNHISDCDFPSLCSANHFICVAYINDKPVLLDPTDPIHLPQTPVESIQKRSIFIINRSGGEFYKVNGFSPQQNAINYRIALQADSGLMVMRGDFNADYEGISGNFLRRQFIDLSNDEMNTTGEKHYESVFGNQVVTDLNISEPENSVEVQGKLTVKGKIFNDSGHRYLFIDFLPHLIENVSRETLLEGIYLGSTFDKKVNLRVIMDAPFASFGPVEHTFTNKGISLDIKISNPEESVIECEYEFILEHTLTEKNNLDIINEILESFKKITNEPIILND